MVRNWIRFLQGYVKIRVIGDSPERFINLCSHHGIHVSGIDMGKCACEMYMLLENVRKIRPLARKSHMKVKIIGKYGLPFYLYRYRRRKLFFFGALLAVGLVWLYSTYIWDIHFEGNDKWTDTTLLDYLKEQDVQPGMKKSEVNCSDIAAEIRKEYNDIVWVSASVEGSCLNIQVKENEDIIERASKEAEQPTDLVASADGVITRMITRNGTPLVHEGDEVKKGDILVSGRIDVIGDYQEVVGYQYCQADADIYADTEIVYNDTIENTYFEKQMEEEDERRKWYLSVMGYEISIGTEQCDTEFVRERIQTEHQIRLGENFYLPVSFGEIQVNTYKNIEKKYTKEEIQVLLTERFMLFLEDLEKKGIQIRENSVKIKCYENHASAQGILYLNESITESADTEILTIERKETDESGRIAD